jgi:uncharacterized OsmC-like protein
MNAISKTKAPTVVNGINVDDVQALAAAVQADPETNGKTSWRVTTAWQGRTHTRARVEAFHLGGQKVARQFSFDVDEPAELGGGNAFANPQEYLLGALNACMTVGYVALCALQGITLEKLEIETEGDIDLRGFFGLDRSVPPGYESLRYTVRVKGNGTPAQFAEIHKTVMATSPNFHNIARAVTLNPTLVVE